MTAKAAVLCGRTGYYARCLPLDYGYCLLQVVSGLNHCVARHEHETFECQRFVSTQHDEFRVKVLVALPSVTDPFA